MNIQTGNIIKWTDAFDQENTSEILGLNDISAFDIPMYLVHIRDMRFNNRRNYYLEDLEKGLKEIFKNIEEYKEAYPEEFI